MASALLHAAVLVGTTAFLGVALVVAVAAVPVAPTEHDADGVYVQTPRDPSDGPTSSCTGRPVTRLACLQREREERMDELQERMETMDVPSIDVPDLDLVVPELDALSDVDVPTAPPTPTP